MNLLGWFRKRRHAEPEPKPCERDLIERQEDVSQRLRALEIRTEQALDTATRGRRMKEAEGQ